MDKVKQEYKAGKLSWNEAVDKLCALGLWEYQAENWLNQKD